MNHKIPVQSLQLRVMDEDLVLKRKVAEQSESADKEYLAYAVKITKTMETMGCTGSFFIALSELSHFCSVECVGLLQNRVTSARIWYEQ